MKILYIALSCGPNLGSEDAVGWNVPLEVAKLGNDVTVLTRRDKREEIEEYISTNPGKKYPKFIYIELPRFAQYFNGPLYSLRAKLWCNLVSKSMVSICSSTSYDVIHQITPVEFRSIVDLDGAQGLKVLGPVGGGGDINPQLAKRYLNTRERFNESIRSLVNSMAVSDIRTRKALLSHDIVMAANTETANLLRMMGWKEEIEIHSEVAANRRCRNSLRNNKHAVIGFAGRLHYGKGILFLLDVMSQLKDYGMTLLIAGDGPQNNVIRNKINELGLNHSVKMLGRLSYHEMQKFYDSIDIFAFPSFREATGTVLVESLASSVPVVAFNRFGAKELLDTSPELLVSINSSIEKTIDKFAETLVKVAQSKTTPVPPDTWEVYASKLIDIYQSA